VDTSIDFVRVPGTATVALLVCAGVFAWSCNTGRRDRGTCVVERIDIRGNVRTRDKTIRRAMRSVEGLRFDPAGIDDERARIEALGFFDGVSVSAQAGSQRGQMRIAVDVREKPGARSGFTSAENFLAICRIAQAEPKAEPATGETEKLRSVPSASGLPKLRN
jgi:hypothetical protein